MRVIFDQKDCLRVFKFGLLGLLVMPVMASAMVCKSLVVGATAAKTSVAVERLLEKGGSDHVSVLLLLDYGARLPEFVDNTIIGYGLRLKRSHQSLSKNGLGIVQIEGPVQYVKNAISDVSVVWSALRINGPTVDKISRVIQAEVANGKLRPSFAAHLESVRQNLEQKILYLKSELADRVRGFKYATDAKHLVEHFGYSGMNYEQRVEFQAYPPSATRGRLNVEINDLKARIQQANQELQEVESLLRRPVASGRF